MILKVIGSHEIFVCKKDGGKARPETRKVMCRRGQIQVGSNRELRQCIHSWTDTYSVSMVCQSMSWALETEQKTKQTRSPALIALQYIVGKEGTW